MDFIIKKIYFLLFPEKYGVYNQLFNLLKDQNIVTLSCKNTIYVFNKQTLLKNNNEVNELFLDNDLSNDGFIHIDFNSYHMGLTIDKNVYNSHFSNVIVKDQRTDVLEDMLRNESIQKIKEISIITSNSVLLASFFISHFMHKRIDMIKKQNKINKKQKELSQFSNQMLESKPASSILDKIKGKV